MRAIGFGFLALLGCVWAADKRQPLNVRPGLWETTMTTTTSGEMPIPAELLSKLTPEQRIKMEQKMKDNSGEKTRTLTDKSCVTKEQIEKGLEFGHEQGRCTRTVVNSTGSVIDLQVTCADEGMNTRGTMHFEALSPESMNGTSQMTANGGGHAMTVHMSFTSKWLGPTCSQTD